MPVILILERLSQDDGQEFEVSLGNLKRPRWKHTWEPDLRTHLWGIVLMTIVNM